MKIRELAAAETKRPQRQNTARRMAAQAYVFPKDGIADDHVTLDFEGVKVLAPSRADEFITGIKNNYTKNISYLNTANPSVAQTLKTLEDAPW